MTLTLEGVQVRYGPVRALAGVDLEVRPGQVVAVLGPSGSGKSTLLRAVAGLEPLAAGRIRWDGRDLQGVPPHRRGFGLMFQEHLLFGHTDVAGNVAFGLRVQGLGRAEIHRRVARLLDLVGLPGYEHRSVTSLSGGEAQRVALARALAPGPALLMLDEPLGSLDRPRREQLVGELGALLRDAGVTVLFVTHDQDEAFALAERVVVLAEGRVVEDGPAHEVWARPRSVTGARFLGFVNETAGHVTGKTATVDCPWGSFRAPGPVPSGPVRVLARPDALHLDGRATGGAGPALRAEVTGRTFRRDRFLVQVRGPDGPLLTAADPDALPEVGATVTVGVDPDRVLVLPDPGTAGRSAR